eukprot:CAMPEP_0181403534 /NCGR_PEP_ID=MMETSP1110-20121109/3758_1 /TAXON_ID=174948 /ORGANISM="Symbiodinium sp., Strain CCMP421" /LENGTH=508 /DNA_ID=CAMNT_0023525823 /DNA_START=70 /DNA_END=1596 /DNA_ORIENTATION=+
MTGKMVSEDESSSEEEQIKETWPPFMMLAQLCCISAIEGIDMGLLPAVTFALQHDLNLKITQIGSMSLAQSVAQALGAPVWGVLADRKVARRKTLLAIGAFFQGLCTIALGWTENLAMMIIIRSINGAMLAGLRPVCVGIVADTTSELSRGKIYGYLQLSVTAGMMIATSVGTPMATASICGIQGWRVVFALVGAFAIFTSLLISVFMFEARHERSWNKESRKRCSGVTQEIAKFCGYFRKPTFVCLIGQGLFGAIPWNAFNYSTLYFQVVGLPEVRAASLTTAFQACCGIGNVLGGYIGDALARRCPEHGRAFTANMSVSLGIPCVFLIYMTQPSEDYQYIWYLSLLVLMGLTATWCLTGVNLPLLSEIVDPASRSGIMAWESAMEGAIAAVAGNAAVTFLAHNFFGYDLVDADPSDAAQSRHNAEALGKALAFTSVLPWTLCLICYIFMHWAFPYDRRIILAEREKYRDQQGRLLTGSTTVSEDQLELCLDDEEDENLEYLPSIGC